MPAPITRARLKLNAVPAPFTYGNSARNSLFGPGIINWDQSLYKRFGITDRMSLEFRAEFFNIMNHANFEIPAANISVPSTVGKITSTNNVPRDIQERVCRLPGRQTSSRFPFRLPSRPHSRERRA